MSERRAPQLHPDNRHNHAVLTGPARGEVVLEDGTVYDFSEPLIYTESLDHAQQVADHIEGLSN